MDSFKRIKKLEQRNIKFTIAANDMIEVVTIFEERLNAAEMLREWILNKLKQYPRNPRFKRFLKNHPDLAKKAEAFSP